MAANLCGSGGAPQSSNSDEKYVPNVKDIMAIEDGLISTTETHTYRKAGRLPKAPWMYEYSPPDLGIKVPSSQ